MSLCRMKASFDLPQPDQQVPIMSEKPAKKGSKICALWKNWKGSNKKSDNERVDLAVQFVSENAAHCQVQPIGHPVNRSFFNVPDSNLQNANVVRIQRDLRPDQHRARDPHDESYFNGSRLAVAKIIPNADHSDNKHGGHNHRGHNHKGHNHSGYLLKSVSTKNHKLSVSTHPHLLTHQTHPTDDCIVPDLYKITQLSFFWQDLDLFKAEELLADKPEGSFLLRISSQPNYLFSVSFRSHNRSLHARIEKENNLYSFDSKDAESQKFTSICDLFKNYRESKRYLFEPVLTHPLNNPNPHTLKQLSQYAIISMCNYHHIDRLPLPQTLKDYLKSFNYCSYNLR